MLIFSDNQNLPNKFLGLFVETLPESTQLPSDVRKVHNHIFSTKKTFRYELRDINYWQYLFLLVKAKSSQFDLLVKLNSLQNSLPDGIICIAEKGTGFHGFRNRHWDTKSGNLHLSLSFVPKETFNNFPAALLIASAVSIIETIDSIPGMKGKALTKWVNDIIVDNSKVGGIITQTSSIGNQITNAFIGIGLNILSRPVIMPDIFTPQVACLKDFTDLSIHNIPDILKILLYRLSININLINSREYQILFRKYCNRSAVVGKQAEVYTDPFVGDSKKFLKGKIIGIGTNLELIFKNKPYHVRSGRLKLIE